MTAAVSTGTASFAGSSVLTAPPTMHHASLVVADFVGNPAQRAMRVRVPPELAQDAARPLTRALMALARLRQLAAGWDGEQAQPITDDAARAAAGVLVALALPTPPTAQLVPLRSGGVQLEWHVDGNDVEVEIDPLGDVHVFVAVSDGEVLVDRELPPSLIFTVVPEVRRYLLRMARLIRESDFS